VREIQVDLASIRNNYRNLKKLAGDSLVMAVVKANAYGHGMHEVAKALEDSGVDYLGVADLNEALELRMACIKAPILCWILSPEDDFGLALSENIELGVSSFEVLEKLPEGTKVHLKVDTGLGRNGFTQSNLGKALEFLAESKLYPQGIFSHLSNTSDKDDLAQLELFEKANVMALQKGVEFKLKHLAASAATLKYPQMHFDMVRCGIAVYGLSPFEDEPVAGELLQPAMRVVANVVNVKRVPEGQGVSYGYQYVTKKETTLVLVPFGYAEGMPRISENHRVLIQGELHPVVGRVAMDQFIVDVSDAKIQIGAEVVIFGNGQKGEPTAQALGESSGSINYEVVTRIGGRAPRVYKN
jgi:alanine racemase